MKNPVTKIKKTAAGEALLFFGLVGAWHREKKRGRKNTLPNALMMNGFVSVGCRKKGEKTHLN